MKPKPKFLGGVVVKIMKGKKILLQIAPKLKTPKDTAHILRAHGSVTPAGLCVIAAVKNKSKNYR